ncbi:hypothetical protein, partial [Aeromonas salmonicida]
MVQNSLETRNRREEMDQGEKGSGKSARKGQSKSDQAEVTRLVCAPEPVPTPTCGAIEKGDPEVNASQLSLTGIVFIGFFYTVFL